MGTPATPNADRIKRLASQVDRAAVTAETLNQLIMEAGDGLLTEDELTGLEAALPRLFGLAVEMGVAGKPLTAWSKQEIMRFLVIALRAAVPLRVVSFTLATDDGAPA